MTTSVLADPTDVDTTDVDTEPRCVFCDGRMDPERAAMRAYCLMPECVTEGFKPRLYAGVGVHKSIPTIMPMDQATGTLVAGGRRRP